VVQGFPQVPVVFWRLSTRIACQKRRQGARCAAFPADCGRSENSAGGGRNNALPVM